MLNFLKIRTQRLLHWLVRIREFIPFTGPSLVLCGIALLSFKYFAIEQSDFFIRSSITVFLYVFATLSVVTMATRFLISRRLTNLQFSCESSDVIRQQRLVLEANMRNFRVFPLVEVHVHSTQPHRYTIEEAQNRRNRRLILIPRRRGHLTQIELTFVVGDIFGLNRTSIRRTTPLQLDIQARHPALETTELRLPNEGDESAHPAGSLSGDYVDMRRYAPGDPQRFILWKAFARSRKLLVRTPERAESKEPAVALVLLTSPADAEAADVVRYFLEQGHQSLAFCAAGLSKIAVNSQDALELLKASGTLIEPSLDTMFDALTPFLEGKGQRLIVVASPEDEHLDIRLAALRDRLNVSPYVILASSVTQQPKNSRWQRLGVTQQSEHGPRFKTLLDAIGSLNHAELPFEVINPESGRRWEARHWHH
ncbi:MAG: DUF58 domain-containing protein [Bradymonadia bacterium]